MECVFADINADHGNCAVEALGHGVLLCLWSPLPDSSLAGQEHGRTIPKADISGSRLLPCNLSTETRFVGRKSLGSLNVALSQKIKAQWQFTGLLAAWRLPASMCQ